MGIGGQLRLTQYVGHIGLAQYINLTHHLQIVQGSLHTAIEVDIRLSESLRTGILLGIDEQEVLGTHAHIELHVLHIRKIQVALNIQRTFVVGIHHEILEEQLTVDDAHWVIGKSHGDAVWHTHQISRIQIYLAIHIQVAQRSLHGQLAFSISLQTHQLVGNETVDKVQRQSLQTDFGIEFACASRLVGTRNRGYFLAIIGQDTIHIVRSVALWHIGEFGTDISHRTFLVYHVVYLQV